MKKLALFLLAEYFMLPLVNAQTWSEGKFMLQALEAVLENATASTQLTSFGYTDGICFMGGWIDDSGYCSWETKLVAGTSYQFWGGGDEDAVDLDLFVLDKSGTILAKDKDADNSPLVSFTPTTTANYVIKLSLFNCAEFGSFCALATLQKGANTIPFGNIEDVMQTLEAVGETILEEKDINLKFMKIENMWSVFGAVIDEDKEAKISNLVMGQGDRFLVGVTDDNAEVINVILRTYPGSKMVCSDEEDSKLAAVRCKTTEKDKYQLTIKNAGSDGKSLMIAAIFDLE
ncbi:MAG TPA: hypothetical protein PLR06_05305, partial [Cyclobacteriaceae bacterium]|nr:hypothetical protein [Cyclobacteriaceae bacterium]